MGEYYYIQGAQATKADKNTVMIFEVCCFGFDLFDFNTQKSNDEA